MSDLTVAHDEIAMPFEDYQKLLRQRDLLAEALRAVLHWYGEGKEARFQPPLITVLEQARAALKAVEGKG